MKHDVQDANYMNEDLYEKLLSIVSKEHAFGNTIFKIFFGFSCIGISVIILNAIFSKFESNITVDLITRAAMITMAFIWLSVVFKLKSKIITPFKLVKNKDFKWRNGTVTNKEAFQNISNGRTHINRYIYVDGEKCLVFSQKDYENAKLGDTYTVIYLKSHMYAVNLMVW